MQVTDHHHHHHQETEADITAMISVALDTEFLNCGLEKLTVVERERLAARLFTWLHHVMLTGRELGQYEGAMASQPRRAEMFSQKGRDA